MAGVQPDRVLADLRALDELTGGPGGARRIAWTDTWRRARGMLESRAAEIGLSSKADRAGNLWTFLRGKSDEVVVVGSHLDSVPAGGWLDGALGVFAGLELLRTFAAEGTPEKSLALVDWADEEGARFGRSLVGSSAFTGTLERADLETITDAEGQRAEDVLAANGVDLDALGAPDPLLGRVRAYLELHIEQGPVLERAGVAAAAVTGTIGIERDRLVFDGQSAHAGTTPMADRRDALLAAAESALAVDRLAIEAAARATCGRLDMSPGVPTAVIGHAELYVDLRHDDAPTLARLRDAALMEATRIAQARRCTVRRERVWSIEPRPFDARLVDAAVHACAAVGGGDFSLPSGALHDAAELAPLVPTAMIFCASLRGLSHTPEEDSTPADIACSIEAFELLARSALQA